MNKYTGKVVRLTLMDDHWTAFIQVDGSNIEFKRFSYKFMANCWLKRRLRNLNDTH